MTTVYTTVPTPLGELLLAGGEAGLQRLHLPKPGSTEAAAPDDEWARDDARFRDEREQLRAYFGRELKEFDVALDLAGTRFQQAVWRALQAIPYGTTASYGEIAARVGQAGAARAVGAANHNNPVAIIVPCHRVVGATGRLTGYAGGLDRKRLLLDLEAGIAPLSQAG